MLRDRQRKAWHLYLPQLEYPRHLCAVKAGHENAGRQSDQSHVSEPSIAALTKLSRTKDQMKFILWSLAAIAMLHCGAQRQQRKNKKGIIFCTA